MSNQIRAAELLRQAASALLNVPVSSTNAVSTESPSTSMSGVSVQNAVRNIFAPYRGSPTGPARSANRRRGNGTYGQMTPQTYWSHRFCLLSSTSQETVPTREEKHELYLCGFGEKKITFQRNDDPHTFKEMLEEKFPSLKSCGGYELLRTAVGSRVCLEVIRMPGSGFTSNYLANDSNLGQAMCYLRPIQKDFKPLNGPDLVVRNIFAPYRGSSTGPARSANRRRGNGTYGQMTPQTYWSHRFCLLSSTSQEAVPTREEKHEVYLCGFGEKKKTFQRNDDPHTFKEMLEEKFPSLKSCGGYELLRTAVGSRVCLEVIRMPGSGFTSNYLANDSNLGQAMCYLRPIQKDLKPLNGPDLRTTDDKVFQECFQCTNAIPLSELREHLKSCPQAALSSDDESNDSDMPRMKKRKRQRSICQYTCTTDREGQHEEACGQKDSEETMRECPVCQKSFLTSHLESHAATCGDSCNVEENTTRSLTEALHVCQKKEISPDLWFIAVIRRHFIQTAEQQFEDAEDNDWKKTINVKFIGEEGIDSGGLSREFFSMFFELSPVFEGSSFSLNAEGLEKQHYKMMGKAIAMAILSGHPGPACLHSFIVDYILLEKEPNYKQLTVEQLQREDIVCAIRKIESADSHPELTLLMAEYADLFEVVGFHKSLTKENKNEAKRAVLKHFLFFRIIPAILQCIEGLKLHGVLDALRRFPEEGAIFLKIKGDILSADVINLFVPVYSTEDQKKAAEEMLIYNFHQLLKKIERGNLQTVWIDFQDPDTQEPPNKITVTMRHLIKALVGSPSLPRGMKEGLIPFDHASNRLVTVNTCAPSISLSNIAANQNYQTFEDSFLNIIVGAPGFGIE